MALVHGMHLAYNYIQRLSRVLADYFPFSVHTMVSMPARLMNERARTGGGQLHVC
jgi:hypothetical protein